MSSLPAPRGEARGLRNMGVQEVRGQVYWRRIHPANGCGADCGACSEKGGGWVMYRCGNCQRELELAKDEPVRCPFCGYKILFKVRSATVKRVKAR